MNAFAGDGGQGGLAPVGLARDGEVEDHAVFIEPGEGVLDFGDAPDPTYPTLLASNGASHVIGGPWLGDRTDVPDAELDGQPDAAASGDDKDLLSLIPNDDEDGVAIPLLVQGQPENIEAEINSVSGGTNSRMALSDFLFWASRTGSATSGQMRCVIPVKPSWAPLTSAELRSRNRFKIQSCFSAFHFSI